MDPDVESAHAKSKKMYEYFMDIEFWRLSNAVHYGIHEQKVTLTTKKVEEASLALTFDL
tara:strand:- start:185 stop:361 length:177 start_codon:yes stop_codon:yes gene_type:complete